MPKHHPIREPGQKGKHPAPAPALEAQSLPNEALNRQTQSGELQSPSEIDGSPALDNDSAPSALEFFALKTRVEILEQTVSALITPHEPETGA